MARGNGMAKPRAGTKDEICVLKDTEGLKTPRTFISECELTFTFAMMSSSARPSVCLSSATFVHPTQATQIFGKVSTPFGTLANR